MLLGIEFPPTSAEWTFLVAAAVILLGPLLVERIGLPVIVGVILGGLLVGPFVLGWVEREDVVESLGQLGILFLMFLAGLELDLDEFAANRRAALTFGAFTFALSFVLGIALVLPFGYGAATAMLFGSLWASMTTPRSSSTRVLAATLSRRFSKRTTWLSCQRGSARSVPSRCSCSCVAPGQVLGGCSRAAAGDGRVRPRDRDYGRRPRGLTAPP